MSMPAANTLIELLEIRASETPEKAAFVWQGKPCSFADLWHGVNRFGGYLRGIGIAKGHRVVLALPNGPEFFFAFYGTQRAGALAVPLFPGSGATRILAMAKRCGAGALVVPSTDLEIRRSEMTSDSLAGVQVISVSESWGPSLDTKFPEAQRGGYRIHSIHFGQYGRPQGGSAFTSLLAGQHSPAH